MANRFFWQKLLSKFGLGESDLSFSEIKFKKLNEINLNFEKKLFYVLFSPLFLIISLWVWFKKKIIPHPKTNFYFFDGVSKLCREVKENAANWRALDLTYNNYSGNDTFLGDSAYNFFWHTLKNAQALRNRLKLTKFLLLKNIEEISKTKTNRINREIRLISIASGSAQGVIEAITLAKTKGILVKAILIDLDPSAIEYSKRLVEKMGIKDQFIFVNKTVSIINEIGKGFKPNLIEMVGFLEYRPFDKALKLINAISQILENEGIFLVSQITPNLESSYLKEVINWSMIYRKPEELAKILSLGGFSLKKCSFYWEPLKIHYVGECKKL